MSRLIKIAGQMAFIRCPVSLGPRLSRPANRARTHMTSDGLSIFIPVEDPEQRLSVLPACHGCQSLGHLRSCLIGTRTRLKLLSLIRLRPGTQCHSIISYLELPCPSDTTYASLLRRMRPDSSRIYHPVASHHLELVSRSYTPCTERCTV